MLVKAPWTLAMATLHVRQAALTAIAKGWLVKATNFKPYLLTSAELAVAAVTYGGARSSCLPDDPTQAIFALIEGLPTGLSCEKLISKGVISRDFCQCSSQVPVPTLTCAETWIMNKWQNIHSALHKAAPFPWRNNRKWYPKLKDTTSLDGIGIALRLSAKYMILSHEFKSLHRS